MTIREWRLRDERDFLRRSIEDAESEHAEGGLSDEDYELLRARDARRLADVEAALAAASAAETPDRRVAGTEAGDAGTEAGDAGTEAGDAGTEAGDAGTEAGDAATGGTGEGRPEAKRERTVSTSRATRRWVFWRRRWWLAAAGVVLVVAAAVVLVDTRSSPRLPGQYATGSIDLNTAQKIEHQLAQAKALAGRGKSIRALRLYGTVLTEDPKQPVALAEWGWLDWEAASKAKQQALASEGASALVEAVKLDPSLFAAQYYLGTVLLQEGDPAKAVAHYRRFLADHPSAAWRHQAAPEIRTAFTAAHQPLPSKLSHG